jgi:galactose-1-phosphate uridylyltransferase
VPNKFPALQIEGDLNRQGDGMYDKMTGIGAHEVVIETPEHGDTLASMSERGVEDVLWAFRDRILDLKRDQRFRYILVFKNHGEAASCCSSPRPSSPSGCRRSCTGPRSITTTRSAASSATSSGRR